MLQAIIATTTIVGFLGVLALAAALLAVLDHHSDRLRQH